MKKTFKTYVTNPKYIISLLLLIALTVFGIYLIQSYYAAQDNIEFDNFSHHNIVKPQDLTPLVIPKQTILNGRVLKIPILMYHHVGSLPPKAGPTRVDLTVSPADFETQVKWLSKNGYKSIGLKDLYQYSQKKLVLPMKPVILTFDDGYQDVFDNAIPILKKYDYTGSFAIITQFAGARMGDNVYASWGTIATAYQAGNEIVSHTQNHFDGSNKKYSTNFIYQNLSGSIADIQDHLNFTTNILIYPYGHYSPAYVDQAKKNGFVMGVTVHEGNTINLDNLMEIPRVRVHGKEDFERFKKIVSE